MCGQRHKINTYTSMGSGYGYRNISCADIRHFHNNIPATLRGPQSLTEAMRSILQLLEIKSGPGLVLQALVNSLPKNFCICFGDCALVFT